MVMVTFKSAQRGQPWRVPKMHQVNCLACQKWDFTESLKSVSKYIPVSQITILMLFQHVTISSIILRLKPFLFWHFGRKHPLSKNVTKDYLEQTSGVQISKVVSQLDAVKTGQATQPLLQQRLQNSNVWPSRIFCEGNATYKFLSQWSPPQS